MHNYLQQYPDIKEFVEKLIDGMQKILGEKLVGVYLYGSLVWGDFDYDSSYIDLLVATKNDITNTEFDKLKGMQNTIAKEYTHGREEMYEIAYISLHALNTFKTERNQIAIVSPGEPFHLKDAGNDWLLNWYFVREKGVTLFGVPPETIITPISKEEFVYAVQEQTKDWREWIEQSKNSRPYQAYAILTLCRAYYAFKNGDQVSKKEASEWTAKQLPQWSQLIQNAFKWRIDWRNKKIDNEATFPETKQFVHFIIDEITK